MLPHAYKPMLLPTAPIYTVDGSGRVNVSYNMQFYTSGIAVYLGPKQHLLRICFLRISL